MIKKIICPTDFSETANNAIEYAAKVAQVVNAELEIVNVRKLLPMEIVGEDIMEGAEALYAISNNIHKTFEINCSYDFEVTHASLEKIINAKAGKDTWIIMGTNGIDDLYQYFFGTNTYKVIKKSECPVLLIPEHVSYKTIKKMVFALDNDFNKKPLFMHIKDYLNAFKPEIILLYVAKSHSDSNTEIEEVFRSCKNELNDEIIDFPEINLKKIIFDNIPEGINNYISITQADILAITFRKYGFIEKVFHYSVSKELTETAAYPIWVLPVPDEGGIT